MKLLTLSLKNFKGIKSFKLDTQGKDVKVFGDNATGKTTLFDAFLWLLFDKDSQNKKDFDIKTLDQAGTVLHGLEHEVEAALDVSGRPVTLRKVYAEKWTKKRGSASKEFTGHTTDYFINGVPVKKNEYTARVGDIADEETFKLLTSPAYFNEQLHWTKRRETLLDVCGYVSDEEVINSDKSLAKLPEILKGRSLDDHRKVIAARRTELNKELEKIPTRIDEVQLGLPDISMLDADQLPKDIAKAKALLKQKQDNLLQLESGGEVAQKKNELSEINADLLALKNEYQAEIDAMVSEKRKALTDIELRLSSLRSEISGKESDVASNLRRIDNLKTKAAQLRNKWNEVNAQQLELNQESICPTCGQDVPEEKLEEARATAEAAFNREKADKLASISAEGKTTMAEVTELERQNVDIQAEIEELGAQLEATKQEANGLKQAIESIRSENTLDNYPSYAQKLQEKAKLEEAIATMKAGNSEVIAKAKEEIAQAENDIAILEGSLANVRRYEEGQKRIEQLKAQEKQLAAEYAKLEEELYLTEQFIRTKVSMLEEKINSRFKMARFKLFDVQINGGVVECCETIYKGVPYSSGLNNAARINVGLDIINTLSQHYGFSAPIFVDNREAVTKLIETEAQVISLIVSEPDKKLRVEVASKEKSMEVA